MTLGGQFKNIFDPCFDIWDYITLHDFSMNVIKNILIPHDKKFFLTYIVGFLPLLLVMT